MINVAIVGSRLKYWEEIGAVNEARKFINEYIWYRRNVCHFISGRSPGGGVDEWAETFCIAHIIPFTAKPPVRFTTQEFHRRNQEIVDSSDVVVVFFAGKQTGGSKYTMDYAIRMGKRTVVYTYKEGQWVREEFNVSAIN